MNDKKEVKDEQLDKVSGGFLSSHDVKEHRCEPTYELKSVKNKITGKNVSVKVPICSDPINKGNKQQCQNCSARLQDND